MKKFIYILLFLAVALLIFNITQLNFDDLFGEESSGSFIGILASLCVIVLMFILLVSRKIQQRVNKNSQ